MESAAVSIQIKTPSGANPSVRTFVVGITDLIPIGYDAVRDAEERYKANVLKWKRLVLELQSRKSEPLLRWRLGNEINRFFRVLEREHNIVITNQLEALSHDLGLSHDSLGFITRFPVQFSRTEVETSDLSWSKFQELMGIKNSSSRRECFRLLRAGKIRYDKQIRAFKRAANRGLKATPR